MKYILTKNWITSGCLAVLAIGTIACGDSGSNQTNGNRTPANQPATAKPDPTLEPQAETKPVGREIKVVDGPALKSVIPPDDAVLGGLLNEFATSLPTPEFPEDSKETGKVTVEVLVNEKGEVRAASAVDGPQPLRAAAVKAARDAKFDPPLKDGKPVKVGGTLTFERK